MHAAEFVETKAFVQRMRREGLADGIVEAFCDLYGRYRHGDLGKLPWEGIRPPDEGDIVFYRDVSDPQHLDHGRRLLDQLVVISLNGGLGTTMKMNRAKSLVPVRQGLTFLDLTARQIVGLRQRHGIQVPWLMMNSFRTRQDCLSAPSVRELQVDGLPLDFLQNKFPRIERASALPLELADEQQNWAPPGHGDIYLALWHSGLLERLLERGLRWAFVSNVDNLGGTVDPNILGYLDRNDIQFAMEVADRSPADVKGGTLVRFDGRLMLLEGAQVEQAHQMDFQDRSVFSVFNTNSVWWRLDAMRDRLRAGALRLPMIVNPKTVQGVELIQLETAMGAAVGCFERSVGINVPRSRFAPVKATCDLLAVRSDAYVLDEDAGIRPSSRRDPALGPPVITLDSRYYQGIDDFESRFAHPLSLVDCSSLTVEGDICFGRDVRLLGDVVLRNPDQRQKVIQEGSVFGPGAHMV